MYDLVMFTIHITKTYILYSLLYVCITIQGCTDSESLVPNILWPLQAGGPSLKVEYCLLYPMCVVKGD